MASASALSIGSILLIYLVIMGVAAVFVYRDAKKREMNRKAWGIVAFFGPFLLGTIIYFICRKPLVDLACPKCGAGLAVSATECPECKSTLLTMCPQCEFPVQKGWKSCPECGKEFVENYEQPIRTYRKDNGVAVVSSIVIFLVVGILMIVIPLNTLNQQPQEDDMNRYEYSGIGMYNITEEELARNGEIAAWIAAGKDSKEKIQILVSEKSETCLIYVKNHSNLMSVHALIDCDKTASGEVDFKITESEYEDLFGYHFFLYEVKIGKDMKINVKFNAEETKAKVTYTDADISRDTWRVNR